MTPFGEAFLASLTASLGAAVVKATGRRLGQWLATDERTGALERCCEAGIVALVDCAVTSLPEEQDVLAHIFGTFFTDEEIGPEVGREVAGLLKGNRLDTKELDLLFCAAGFDPETLRGLDLATAFAAFEGAFVEATIRQPVLQGEIQIHELREQTGLEREMLGRLEAIVEFLARAERRTVALGVAGLAARNAAGIEIKLDLSQLHVTAPATDWSTPYLRTLVAKCDLLDLSPLYETSPHEALSKTPVRISDVFTQLDLKGLSRAPGESVGQVLERLASTDAAPTPDEARLRGGEEDEPAPITAAEAVAVARRLVVLGQPGGGKSTLVSHITTELASARLGEAGGSTGLPGWPAEVSPLPVRIVLRRFAAWVPAEERNGDAGLVWRYLEHLLSSWGLKEAYESLQRTLWEEGAIVFFDGLDEVRESDAEKKRSLLRDSIVEFSKPLKKCQVIVTCREYAYRKDDAWHLPQNFLEVELAPFSLPQVDSFTRTWYRVVVAPRKGWGGEQSDGEARNLYRAIERLPHLRALGESPLLLTLMAQLHGHEGYLPENRADLYERTLRLLLAHWDNPVIRDLEGGSTVEPDLVLRLDLPARLLRSALEEVALKAHERQEQEADRGEGAADIPRADLRDALSDRLGSVDKADEVVEYMQERAGVLLAHGRRTYRFPHRTFQEYLASQYLLTKAEYDTLLKERINRDLAWWREVYLLAAGSRRDTPRLVADLVEKLVPRGPEQGGVTPAQADRARLVAQTLEETGFNEHVEKEKEKEPGRFTRIFETVQKWLEAGLVAQESLAPEARGECGLSLAGLGDSRPEVTTLEGMQFCWVPAGDFWMGSDDGRVGEKPQHRNEHLDYGYWLGRYPVSVAQLRQAVGQGMKKPEYHDALEKTANHPVVRVSWYEARDFCAWLTAWWREQGLLDDGWAIALPSEAEWEKAARGGVKVPASPLIEAVSEVVAAGDRARAVTLKKNPASKRVYPWQGAFDDNRCNVSLRDTSTLGVFPGGAGPCGCEDLSGNVWEWTRSWYRHGDRRFTYPYDPRDGREAPDPASSSLVLRGGSCFDRRLGVRSAARSRNGPADRYYDVGFRVALLPLQSLEL